MTRYQFRFLADGRQHRADVDNTAWDGPAAMSACAKADDPAAAYNAICAGKKAGDPALQGSHALPHHKHPGDPPNATGTSNALSRLPQTQGLTNEAAAKAHLEAHMKTINPDYTPSKGASPKAQRLAAYGQRGIPSGAARVRSWPGEIRSKAVSRDGGKFLEVEGYASTFGQPYEMWDMFGPYEEEVDHVAFDKSLSAGPDVAFLVNHKGLTMARTVPGPNGRDPSLEVYADDVGLGVHAFLNLARQDVRDFQSALDDGLVTEMSFAFMLNEGWWSEDFERFRITEADIDRGDVSGVNYGANPFTTITARAADVLADLARMPAPVLARAARIAGRRGLDFGDLDFREWETEDATGEEERADGPSAEVADLVNAIDAGLDECVSMCGDMADAGDLATGLSGVEDKVDALMVALGMPAETPEPGEKAAPAVPSGAPGRAATGTSLTLVRARLLNGEED
jgi:Escherichia/Staphylococcus phage prohead protease